MLRFDTYRNLGLGDGTSIDKKTHDAFTSCPLKWKRGEVCPANP